MQNNPLNDILHFPRFWYFEVPAWWWRFLKRVLIYFDNQLAVSLMFNRWLVPVWQDTTLIGRSLSLIFRTTRILIGALWMLLVVITLLFWLAAWFIAPIILFLFAAEVAPLLLVIWFIDVIGQFLSKQRDSVSLLIKVSQGDVNNLLELLSKLAGIRQLLQLIEQEELPSQKINVNINSVIAQARIEQEKVADVQLRVEHLFLALLDKVQFHHDQARQAYIWIKQKKAWSQTPWIWQDNYPIRTIGGVNRDWTGIITPELDKISTDLTQLAAHGKLPELIGRQEKIEEIVRILGSQGRENVIVVGEAGSGKTTLIEGLANEIIRGTGYKSLQFKRLIALDIAALMAGSVPKVKERLISIIEEIKIAGNVILFVDEIHNLVASQEEAASMVFAALEPHLDIGEFQFIATTTSSAYKRYIESSEAFVRTFRKVVLNPCEPQETLQIAKWKAYELENSHGVNITFAGLEAAVELARRYIHDRVLPDSALDLLQATVNKVKTSARKDVTVKDVEEMVTEITQIPVRSPDSVRERTLLLNLEKYLHEQVVGQDEAIENIADALRRARTGMAEEGRLIASFLFAGATGVGKTETAKALAKTYYGSEKAMVRLDMSEFQTAESINRLLGPPPGKSGFEQGGQLTEAVRRRPFTVILMDEIEKANPRILDVFLQLLDDARLTDGSGRTIDFSNTIVIATSNVGTKSLIEASQKGKDVDKLKGKVMDALRERFRPEFLNRFTRIMVYLPLSEEQIKEITRIQLKRLEKNLKKKEILVKVSTTLVDKLVKQGFSPRWGARELRRVIQDEVEEKIAKMILEGKIQPGIKYTLTPEFLS